MATLIGKAQITTLSGAILNFTAVTNYSTKSLPNLQSGSTTHSGNIKETVNQSGQVTSFFNSEEHIEQSFEFIPEANTGAANTLANALVATALPTLLSAVTLSGFPIIAVGSFTDVYNSALWLYKDGGKINQVIDGPWTMSVTLHRHVNVTAIASPA